MTTFRSTILVTADGATVPLYFENRIPALQLVNPNFGEELTQIIEDADLDEQQERKLARLLGQQYELGRAPR